MIVALSATEPARLTDLDRLDRLHAALEGDLADAVFPAWCRAADDGDHVWLDVDACRALGAAAMDDEWPARYDAMIAYAGAKGWTDPSGTQVRAHVERAEPGRTDDPSPS